MEYYDRKATFDVERDVDGVHVKFVSITVGHFEVPLECREDIERLPERDQRLLLEARDRVLQRVAAEPQTVPDVLPSKADVYWAEMGGKMRIDFAHE